MDMSFLLSRKLLIFKSRKRRGECFPNGEFAYFLLNLFQGFFPSLLVLKILYLLSGYVFVHSSFYSATFLTFEFCQ